jgi:transcriptional regulator with XRE-family HTH domain
MLTACETFSRNLKRLLDLHGRKPIELARALKVSPSTISGWMTGRIAPQLNRLDAVAKFFEVSYQELLTPLDGYRTPPRHPMDIADIFVELARTLGYTVRPLPNKSRSIPD